MIKETLKTPVNTLFFSLKENINRKEFDDLKLYARNKDSRILNYLRKKGVVKTWSFGHNLIANEGRSVIAERITGGTTYTGEINYGALGTGTSPTFSTSDTQLKNEVYRKQPSDSSFDGTTAYVDFFIDSGDVADDTYTEWATFIDGNSSANTGRAFSLYATGDWVKSGSVYISSQYNINQ